VSNSDQTGSISRLVAVLRFIGRSTKRLAVAVVGGVLVLAGLAMLVLPGPGIVVIALGLAVLGTEFAWAAHALETGKKGATKVIDTSRKGATKVIDTGRRAARRAVKR
jgi:hypothetical protein